MSHTDTVVPAAAGAATPRRHRRRWIAAALLLALLGAALPLLDSARGVERVAVDTAGARSRLAARSSTPVAATPAGDGQDQADTPRVDAEQPDSDSGGASTGDADVDADADADADADVVTTDGDAGDPELVGAVDLTASSSPLLGGGRTFLVVGSDARPGLGGSRADVILVGVLPDDGSRPVLFSLPRDLWLPDPCGGGFQRINAALNGCAGLASGLELTAIVVEDFTGLQVDHVLGVGFDGFSEVIDAVGGVRICVDRPIREHGKVSLPAGCTLADGDQALGWMRSRKTEELVDGTWQRMSGVNDLTRNRRQQDLVLQLLDRVSSYRTVGSLYAVADGVRDSVVLGDDLSVVDGARLAWSLRGRAGAVQRFGIPVADRVTSGGAQVLVPTESFATTFRREVGTEVSAIAAD